MEKAVGDEDDGKEEGGKGEVGKFEVFLDESARVKVWVNFEEVVDDEEEDDHEVEKGVDEKYGRNSWLMLHHSVHSLLTEEQHLEHQRLVRCGGS